MTNETEQETLDLRLETQGSEDISNKTVTDQFCPTQTSCISLAISELGSPSENLKDPPDENLRGSSGDGSEESRPDSPTEGLRGNAEDDESPHRESRIEGTEKTDSSVQSRTAGRGELEDRGSDKSDSSDESRMESPEPPNENSELNEMDTTFMGGASELDAPSAVSGDPQLPVKTNAPPPPTSDDESGMSSPKCGSDNEADSDQEENEELREARMDEDDEPNFDRGPEITLPYKQPEQLSLREFLARRRSKKSSASQIAEEQGPSTEPAVKPESVEATPEEEERQKRKSKLREEILKAAAKVTPQLSRSSFVAQTPVDQLILKAVSMQNANATSPDAPKKPNNSVPGAQLKELKASLKEKIDEQRKRSRQERTKRILKQNFGEDAGEEEEEEDYETEDDEFDDEEALLARAAEESEAEDGDGRESADVEELADDEADEPEEEGEPEDIGEDSDIDDMTERRKSQKKKKNLIQDSDDEAENPDRDSDEDGDASDGDDNDLDLKIQDDGEEDDASFMHLSQTQVPLQKKKPKSLHLDLDMNNDNSKDVDDDLLALCSGKFATQSSTAKSSRPEAVDDVDEEAEEEENDEEANAEDPEDSDDDDDLEGEADLDPDRRRKKEEDFFEGEAELSGSDVGSDGEDENDGMTEAEKKKFLKSLISENPGISEEELQEQVTRLHFKQLLDDDRKDIRLMKELLLADGDLHSDGPGRERSFKWTNLSNDFVGGNDRGSDDSDHEEETEEEAKWKARRLEREKQRKDEEATSAFGSAKSATSESSRAHYEMDSECEVSIPNVLKEANKALKIVVPERNVDGNPKKVVGGGFLNMNNAVLQKIAEKVKSNAKEKEGSQTTKNFVFRSVDKPEASTKAAKRSSTDAIQPSSKRTKMENLSPLPSTSKTRSIFSKF
ncbi:claspin-like [Galendromus occidentalis]|uniref:Claspin-like n=1 Tax=Galendromus occidentalis TaxID=34638 RepID=A0AAJ7SEM9_9ACAR|nr:claspin-like [Galendromus occidentalis]